MGLKLCRADAPLIIPSTTLYVSLCIVCTELYDNVACESKDVATRVSLQRAMNY